MFSDHSMSYLEIVDQHIVENPEPLLEAYVLNALQMCFVGASKQDHCQYDQVSVFSALFDYIVHKHISGQ